MFVHDSLTFRVRDDLTSSGNDFESVFIEIQRDHGCNIITRAPGSSLVNFNRSFDLYLNSITKKRKLCYIMGDLNLNLVNCSEHQPTDDFINAVFGYGLRPSIDKPTRITPRTSTLVDNILTNSDLDISAGIFYSDISCFSKEKILQQTFITRDINPNSINSFSADIAGTDWNEV